MNLDKILDGDTDECTQEELLKEFWEQLKDINLVCILEDTAELLLVILNVVCYGYGKIFLILIRQLLKINILMLTTDEYRRMYII